MIRYRLLNLVSLAVLVSFGLIAEASQSQPEMLAGDGAIVAFQKHTRYRTKRPQSEMGTHVEVWIVRIDSWENGDKSKGYYLVDYEGLHERALRDSEINQTKWHFTFRETRWHEAESCAGSVPVLSKSGTSYRFRPARMEDFQRTLPGQSVSLPPLKDLPCLIAEKPPTVVKAQRERSALKLEYVKLKGRVLAEATLFPLGTLDWKYTTFIFGAEQSGGVIAR